MRAVRGRRGKKGSTSTVSTQSARVPWSELRSSEKWTLQTYRRRGSSEATLSSSSTTSTSSSPYLSGSFWMLFDPDSEPSLKSWLVRTLEPMSVLQIFAKYALTHLLASAATLIRARCRTMSWPFSSTTYPRQNSGRSLLLSSTSSSRRVRPT